MAARLKTATEDNPGRTLTDNSPQYKYPITYKGFKISRDPAYQHMLRVTHKDGSNFGLYSDERNYTNAIDVFISNEEAIAISHMTRSEFEANAAN
jgi:hypothetical protein